MTTMKTNEVSISHGSMNIAITNRPEVPMSNIESDKIATVVTKVQEILTTRKLDTRGTNYPNIRTAQTDALFDELLGFMLEHFDATSATHESINRLCKSPIGPWNNFEHDLRQLDEDLVPFFVVRALMQTHNLRWKTVPNMEKWYDVYADKMVRRSPDKDWPNIPSTWPVSRVD